MTKEEQIIHHLRIALGNERVKAEQYEEAWRWACIREYVLEQKAARLQNLLDHYCRPEGDA